MCPLMKEILLRKVLLQVNIRVHLSKSRWYGSITRNGLLMQTRHTKYKIYEAVVVLTAYCFTINFFYIRRRHIL
jgi:hypothetical protein